MAGLPAGALHEIPGAGAVVGPTLVPNGSVASVANWFAEALAAAVGGFKIGYLLDKRTELCSLINAAKAVRVRRRGRQGWRHWYRLWREI